MDRWLAEYREERRRSLALREIEAAVDEAREYQPDDPVWREWYRRIVLRRTTDRAVEQDRR